jgi:hypothetical protein
LGFNPKAEFGLAAAGLSLLRVIAAAGNVRLHWITDTTQQKIGCFDSIGQIGR